MDEQKVCQAQRLGKLEAMTHATLGLAQKIAERYSTSPEVEAVALGGSLATEQAEAGSDIDLYVFSRDPLPLESRRKAVGDETVRLELNNDFFGPGDEWVEEGVHVDVMLWETEWMRERLEDVLVNFQASMGYSTAFWHTVRASKLLFDRSGWYAALQRTAQGPYPEALRRNIIAKNHAFLRGALSSYAGQLEKAVKRHDVVSVNHRLAALLASYFDILFAVNRLPHPGEKRLLTWADACALKPDGMRESVESVLSAQPQNLMARVHVLLDNLDALLQEEGLLE